jgi:hypothetical protein
MSSTETIRLGGLSMVIGAVLAFVSTLLSAVLFVGQDPTPYANGPLFVPVNLLGALGAAFLLFGVPLLYLAWSEGWGVLGLIGIVLLFVTGLMFGVFLPLLSIVLVPYLAQHAPDTFKGNGPPAFLPFFITGTLFEVVSVVLLAIPIIRGRLLDRWVGYLLLAVAVLVVVAFFISGPNGPTNVLISLISNLNGLLFFVALGWMGYRLWTGRRGVFDRLTA